MDDAKDEEGIKALQVNKCCIVDAFVSILRQFIGALKF